MTLRFRNIDVSPADPIDRWGVEGILTAIDRGTLEEWSRIASAVRIEPFGPAARNLAEALDLAQDRGVAAVLRRMLADSRQRDDERARAEVRKRLTRYVRESGLSARQFATALGTSPSRMSTYLSGKVVPSAALLVRAEQVAAQRRRDE